MLTKTRLLLVDDHFAIRVGLASSLRFESDLEVVGEAGSGSEAIRLFEEHKPGLVILDWRLPDMTGVETLQKLRAACPSVRVLMLSVYDGEEDIFNAMNAGARGYVLKSAERSELLEAIRKVAAGEEFLPKPLAAKLAARRSRGNLTERELQVLKAIVRGRSNKEIASELGLAEITVKQHLTNVFEKLGVHDRTQAATAAIQRGTVHLD